MVQKLGRIENIHKGLITKLLQWYWNGGNTYIDAADYRLLYTIYRAGTDVVYGDTIKAELNRIRTSYIESNG